MEQAISTRRAGGFEFRPEIKRAEIKTEVLNQDEIKRLRNSDKFSSRLLISPRTGRPYFYFRYHGQQIEGFLGRSYDNAAIHRSKSYILETAHGLEEFFANQRLAKIIEKYALEGKYIRITYIGDERTGFGHARKIYQVEKLAVTDRELIITQTEVLPEQKNGPKHKKRARKPKS